MAKPYTCVFKFPDPRIIGKFFDVTSIVIDASEFDALCDEICISFGSDVAKFDATIAKKSLHIPLLFKEKRTDFLFERYAVVTQAASVIVRGAGPKVASKLLTRDASHESN